MGLGLRIAPVSVKLRCWMLNEWLALRPYRVAFGEEHPCVGQMGGDPLLTIDEEIELNKA